MRGTKHTSSELNRKIRVLHVSMTIFQFKKLASVQKKQTLFIVGLGVNQNAEFFLCQPPTAAEKAKYLRAQS